MTNDKYNVPSAGFPLVCKNKFQEFFQPNFWVFHSLQQNISNSQQLVSNSYQK